MADADDPTAPGTLPCGSWASLLDVDAPVYVGMPVSVRFDDTSDGACRSGWHDATVYAISRATLSVRYEDGTHERIPHDDCPGRLALRAGVLAKLQAYAGLRRRADAAAAARLDAPTPARAESGKAAAASAGANCSARPFLGRLAGGAPKLDSTTLLILDLFSGPFKSIARAANDRHNNVLAATLDIEHSFDPDFVADFRYADIWGLLLRWCVARDGSTVFLPVHIHSSPACQTYVNVSNACNPRSAARPAAAPTDPPRHRAADACTQSLVFLILQLRIWGLPTTFDVENPQASLLWRYPAVRELSTAYAPPIARIVSADYCCYGHRGRKPTRFAVSPELDTAWARTCDGTGSCGSMSAAPGAGAAAALRHLGPTSHGIKDAAIPSPLCDDIVRAAVRLHAPRRLRNPLYCTATVDFCRARQMEWRCWVATSALHAMHGPGDG